MAVFDTGIDYTHSQLKYLVKGGIDLVDFNPGIPMDYNGHGTHVAGTIAAWNYGISKFSSIYAVKILNDDGSGNVSTLLMALQWALDNNIDVVNMSIGFRTDHPLVREAVKQAAEAGLVMVAAVGNRSNWEEDGASGEGASGEGASGEGASGEGASGEGASGEGASGEGASSCTVYVSGEGASGEGASGEGASGEGASQVTCSSKTPYSVMYPAAYPEVIAVSATDADGQIATFANLGSETDIYAPGVEVVSTFLFNGYGISSGTSMATPHVSASVALMLGLAKKYDVDLSFN